MGLRKKFKKIASVVKKVAPVVKAITKSPMFKKLAPLALGAGLGASVMALKSSGGFDMLKGLVKKKQKNQEVQISEVPASAEYAGATAEANVSSERKGILGMGGFLGFL